MKNKISILLTILLFTISCQTKQITMLVGYKYDKKNNQTTLTLSPFGNIVIPNQWTRTSFNASSKQHFFQDKELNTISVAKNLKEKYPFYKATQNDKEFVNEFVKWEMEYFKSQGLEVRIIESKAENSYVIWNAKDKNATKDKVNTFFIFGVKNNFVYVFSGTSKKWSNEKIIEFLRNLYLSN